MLTPSPADLKHLLCLAAHYLESPAVAGRAVPPFGMPGAELARRCQEAADALPPAAPLDPRTEGNRLERIGTAVAELCNLPAVRSGPYRGRLRVRGGPATLRALGATVERIVREGGAS